MVQSARRSVKRWVDGDLEGADEDALKQHLPSLHAKVLEARHNKSQGMGTIIGNIFSKRGHRSRQ